ncbi:hypothetical protein J6590_072138 [Homalodisca vitripennis]|nr:hypothetical protein J6590_072138 [Homalodisca vitripennis]
MVVCSAYLCLGLGVSPCALTVPDPRAMSRLVAQCNARFEDSNHRCQKCILPQTLLNDPSLGRLSYWSWSIQQLGVEILQRRSHGSLGALSPHDGKFLPWDLNGTLRYGIIHYGGTYPTVLQSMIVSQRHAVRNVYQIRKIDRVTRATRSTHNIRLLVPNLKKEKCRHQFSYLAPKLFNELLQSHGDDLYWERKPRFKMKTLQFATYEKIN